MIIYFLAANFFIIGSIVLFFIFRNSRRKHLAQSLGLRLFLIRLPQKRQKESSIESGAGWKNEINYSSQLFGILSGLKSPFCFEAAVHNVGEEIHFYAAVPKESTEFIGRQIEGL